MFAAVRVVCRILTMGIHRHDPPVGPDPLTLSPCRELRKLEFTAASLPEGLDLISSIQSTNIEKIIFNYDATDPPGHAVRTRLYGTVAELARRLGHGIKLDFRYGSSRRMVGEREGFGPRVRLPIFVGKGPEKLVCYFDASGNRVQLL